MSNKKRRYLRFTLVERLEHWALFLSFTTLAITGLVQKYGLAAISQRLIALLGGVEMVRQIHHIAAIALMLTAIYHLGDVGYKIFVLRIPLSMLPGVEDARIAWRAFRYNLGLSQERPQQGRYTFEEKAEYWAVVWGTVVMAITGFMMWNPIATTRFLPGEFIPAAKAAHGGEALLAVLAILVWHVYHVHLRHFNRSMFTGYLDEREMLDEHPLELADRKAGLPLPPDSEQVRRRKRVFYPVYGLLAAAMLAGVYGFVSFEQTAITTIRPAEDVAVFAPLTPTPLPTPLPTKPLPANAPTSWEDGFAAFFSERCGQCHGSEAGLAGLNLSSYESALQGGKDGPAIVPGDPADSLMIIVQAAGDHPGQLSGEELALVRAWIEAGAPEQ